MPITASKPIQFGVFLACLLTVGIPFWRMPYDTVNVPNAFYGPGAGTVQGDAVTQRRRQGTKPP